MVGQTATRAVVRIKYRKNAEKLGTIHAAILQQIHPKVHCVLSGSQLQA